MDFRPTIGLETHVQLATATKLFCGCANRFGDPPNSLVCPICTGQPGVLPVLNERALRLGVRAALALGADVATRTKFDRKHYFYPDLPKGFQISQYDLPFARGGGIDTAGGRVRLHRIHLEEDAGKAIHDRGDGTLVDLNRAGVPLLEIVTEPDLHDPAYAYEYLVSLKERLRFAGVSECDMEKGSLRCDVNVSVHPAGEPGFGTRVEVKNLNSFAMVRRALEHEIERQSRAIERGERIVQETRTWRDADGRTEPLRSKEEAHDYRYFPEPDLPPLEIARAWVGEVGRELPEAPDARRERYRALGLHAEEVATLTADRALGDYFERVAAASGDPKAAAVWVSQDVSRLLNARDGSIADFPVAAEKLASVIALVRSERASTSAARQVLEAMARDSTKGAEDWLRELGLEQVSDTAAIEDACRQVMAEQERAVAEFRAGKEKAIGSLVGAVMKKTGGRANPSLVQETLRRLLRA